MVEFTDIGTEVGMGRVARALDGGEFFHVLVRSDENIKCFESNAMKGFYISCLDRGLNKVGADILAYCVLDDHAHLLVSLDSVDKLSQLMTYSNALFAKWYNSSFSHEGRVFRDRYKSEVIAANIKSITDCVRFVQSDPLRLEIVGNLDKFPFSSFTDYVSKVGIVNFDLAAKYYNPSPDSMRSTMFKLSDNDYLDTVYRKQDCEEEVFGYVIDKYNIRSEEQLKDSKLLKIIAKEIISRTNMSIRELAGKLGVNREKLRRVLNAPDSK